MAMRSSSPRTGGLPPSWWIENYDQLLLAAGQDVRRELKEIVAETRQRIAEAGLERDLVDEAIEAVRSQRQ